MTGRLRSQTGGLFVLTAAVLWGTTGTAATFAPGVSALAIGAAAMGIGGLLQALVGMGKIWASRARLRTVAWEVFAGSVAVAVYPLAFYSSMQLAGVAIGTVVSIGSAPIAAAVIERVLDHRPLMVRWGLSAAAAVGGAVMLCATKMPPAGANGWTTLLGITLGLVAGITYALYSWSAQRMMSRGVERPAAMGAIFGVGGLLLLPVLVASGAPFLASWTNAGVGLYMAIVPMFLGYLAFGRGLASVRASTAIVLTLVEPVVAALLAAIVVGEHIALSGWLGISMVLASVVVVALPIRADYSRRAAGPHRALLEAERAVADGHPRPVGTSTAVVSGAACAAGARRRGAPRALGHPCRAADR